MADPLSALAEREVPAPTNFFNPDDAQRVIAKYGNTRREREGTTALVESANRLSRVRDDEETRARQQVTWDRADIEYEERQNAKRMRGDFLRDMQKQLDPTSPEYTKQVVGFKAGLPPELQEDEVINSILTSMNAEADDFRSQRNAEAAKTQSRDSQLAIIRERAKLGMSYDVRDEDIQAATREDGSIDEFKLGTIAGANRRSNAASEFDRKQKAMVEGRLKVIEAHDLSKRGRERRSTVDKFIVEDRGAFPRHTDILVEEYKKATGKESVDPAILEASPKWRDKFAQANAWDKKPLDNELSAAFAYDDADRYVDLVTGLNKTQKERRRMVWEHAHRDGAVEESDAAASVPASEEAPAAPNALEKQFPGVQAPARKTLTPEIIEDLKKRAGGDPAKAKQLALDEGY